MRAAREDSTHTRTRAYDAGICGQNLFTTLHFSTVQGRVEGLYIVLISLHGLVRGQHMELGKDADTGGQVRH